MRYEPCEFCPNPDKSLTTECRYEPGQSGGDPPCYRTPIPWQSGLAVKLAIAAAIVAYFAILWVH